MRDPERLFKLINTPERHTVCFCRQATRKMRLAAAYSRGHGNCQGSALGGRIIFIEDYDINVARHIVQGVDVWLIIRDVRSKPAYKRPKSAFQRRSQPINPGRLVG